MKRLLYLGPAPQNIGGISIHIRRLAGLMKNDFDIDYVDEGHVRYDGVFNLRSGNVFRYLRKVYKADIVHIQSGVWLLRTVHIIICKMLLRKKVLVTIHRDPNIEPHLGLTKRLLSHCDYAILVNREGYDAMKSESSCKYVLLPAFLPPIMEEEPKLPRELEQWIERARSQSDAFLMCSNAWNLVLHNGEDLYGLDMCIEAVNNLKNAKMAFYLVFIVASNTDQQQLMKDYKAKISDNGLSDRILIWEEPASFTRVLQKCDLILRTTNTDGDAVSIRESLYYGKPVLASDVVRRPDGVVLFKTRDTDDLTKKIQEVASNRIIGSELKQKDYHKIFLDMYEN